MCFISSESEFRLSLVNQNLLFCYEEHTGDRRAILWRKKKVEEKELNDKYLYCISEIQMQMPIMTPHKIDRQPKEKETR